MPRSALASTLILATAAVVSLAAQLKPVETGRFAVAVLRRDGVLVPFAHFNGRRWSNAWPEPSAGPEIPITLDEVPRHWLKGAYPAGPWTMWTLDGEPAKLEVTRPVVFEAHCLSNVGLQTTYRSSERVPLPHVHPYPKDAIAVFGDVRFGRIEVTAPDSPPRTALAASKEFRTSFNVAERKAIGTLGRLQHWSHPLTEAERERRPIVVDALYRAPYAGGGFVSYFEATRTSKWPGEQDAGCDLITLVQGWIVTQPTGDVQPRTISGNLFDCEMKGAAFMFPLGRLTIDGKAYWLVQWSGWGYEQYAVIEIGEKQMRTVQMTPGGGC